MTILYGAGKELSGMGIKNNRHNSFILLQRVLQGHLQSQDRAGSCWVDQDMGGVRWP
jgi:hypothetical protein